MSVPKRRLIIGGSVFLAICGNLLTGITPFRLLAGFWLVCMAETFTR